MADHVSGPQFRRPAPAVEVLADISASGERFSTVVVMGGHHSSPSEFLDEFHKIVLLEVITREQHLHGGTGTGPVTAVGGLLG